MWLAMLFSHLLSRGMRERRKGETYSSTKRIRHACQCCRSYTSSLSKPHVTVSCRCCQNKGLRQPCHDLADYDKLNDASICYRTRIPDPVSCQEQDRGGEDGWLGPSVQQVNGKRTRDGKREKETGREPVDGILRHFEVECRGSGDGGKCQPLYLVLVPMCTVGLDLVPLLPASVVGGEIALLGVSQNQLTSQLTTMFSSTSCINPIHRLLYTL
jgi:hypothetical protein